MRNYHLSKSFFSNIHCIYINILHRTPEPILLPKAYDLHPSQHLQTTNHPVQL
ncbi:hypothetical protein Syun_009566 [Stephania yunnanensis]|uniref:Uncharacterized protein n=1 Tax=Stephania yunnanensis TaxID=152371 RepID=A0AAP0KEV9_9MAGN